MRRHSAYNYAFDNPIRFIDPDGMMPEEATDGEQSTGDQDPGDEDDHYLNYVFFDQDFNLVMNESGYVAVDAGAEGVFDILEANGLIMEQAGYLYVYLSNEGHTTDGGNVYFDVLRINHKKGHIIQEDHYYPFGATISALSSSAPLSKPNHYKYNGKEEQTEFDINIYDYGARNYDPLLGRFFNIDRFSEKYYDFTPYQYGANNPIKYIDINGDSLWISYGDNQRAYYENGQLYNENGEEYSGDDEFVAAVSKTLGEMNSTEIGQEALKELVGSENNFTFKNKSVKGKGSKVASFTGDGKGGGTINAAVLLNSEVQEGAKLETTAHELFHGVQANSGQSGATINNEVGAFLFGKAVSFSAGNPIRGFGLNTQEGQAFEKAMQSLLYAEKFDLKVYQNALNNFKKGSSANYESNGIYNNFKINSNLSNPVIKRFIPLIR